MCVCVCVCVCVGACARACVNVLTDSQGRMFGVQENLARSRARPQSAMTLRGADGASAESASVHYDDEGSRRSTVRARPHSGEQA